MLWLTCTWKVKKLKISKNVAYKICYTEHVLFVLFCEKNLSEDDSGNIYNVTFEKKRDNEFSFKYFGATWNVDENISK